jgi:hypothetical protein
MGISICIGVFLISVATLVFEISLTRVFSISQWYHFAFMVVSIALFGIGASGTFLSVFPSSVERSQGKILSFMSLLFSLTIILSFIITNRIPFDPYRMAFDPLQIFYISLYYILLSLPFFFAGICIAIALRENADTAGMLYSFSLAGSGAGSLLVLVLLYLGGTFAIVSASLIGAIASIVFSPFNKKNCLTISWIIVVLILSSQPFMQIHISPYKSLNIALRYPGAEILHTEWNSFSRVDVVRSPYVRYAPGLSYNYLRPLPPQLGITTDGGALDAITKYEKTSLEFLDYLTSSAPYKLKKNPKVLVLGSGGGMEVLNAIYHNATSITAVEINPIIVDLLKGPYSEFSGGIYSKVSVNISDSRGFIRSSKDKYDIVQLSLRHGAAISLTGVYALTEDYTYTVEAFEEYLRHLTDQGILVVTRWLLPPPREAPRVVAIATEALEREGVGAPQKHIAVIRSWGTITILIKKGEFNAGEIETLKKFCKEKKFDIVFVPGVRQEEVNIYNRFPEPYYYDVINRILTGDREGLYNNYLFDISPATDDKPFFFHFFKLRKILPTYESVGKKWQPFIEGGYLVHIVFVQALILSLVFIFLPVYRFKKPKEKHWEILTYFLCIGIGYMLIEITLIQKFILSLGHPLYSVSLVLFSILIFSGIGSLLSDKLPIEKRIFAVAIYILAVAILIYLAVLPTTIQILLGENLIVRTVVSSILIAPLAFFMGAPFPLGIRLANTINPDLIPWTWAVNGCASVLSSILAVMIALFLGFNLVLLLAALVYLAGLAFLLRSSSF